MNKLYFKYGAMDSGKTAQALMARYNYEEKGTHVWLIKPETDVRDGLALLHSRIGLEADAFIVPKGMDLKEMYGVLRKDGNAYEVIIADEAQFFTEKQILQLREIVYEYNVPVICYGLRTDFQCRLFPGSKALFQFADDISEVKSVCNCGHKAMVNARLDSDGNITLAGPQVSLGGNEKYESMCWSCFRRALGANGLRDIDSLNIP